MRIGWVALAATVGITVLIGYADAQMARMAPQPDDTVQSYAMRRVDPHKDLPTVVPRYVPPPPEKVVITLGRGGRLDLHRDQFANYRNAQAKVEIRGPCYSACTLITAYVGKADLCIAAGAFFAFHAVRTVETNTVMRAETAVMYWQQPPEIQRWIDRNGGHEKLPLDGYWTMYDRELWAMGYPKCQ